MFNEVKVISIFNEEMRNMRFAHFYNILLVIVLIVHCSYSYASGPCILLEPRRDALCIPLASINRAFRDAKDFFGLKHSISFPSLKIVHDLHEVDLFGLILIQTTKYLATEFHLSQHQIDYLLPQLDLELTEIWGECPINFRSTTCKLRRFREINGQCNNLDYPMRGAAHTPFRYLLPAERPDGVDFPRDPHWKHLPNPRAISSIIHKDEVLHDHAVTVMLIAWGQIIDHDITFTAETKDPSTRKDPDCCKFIHQEKDSELHRNCFPIQIPADDLFYAGYNHQCMNFVRSVAGVRSDCKLGPRTSQNLITSFIDASFVYGSEEHDSFALRTGHYGTLKSLSIFQELGLKDLLPLKLEQPDEGCLRPSDDVFCFLAGDSRANEQLVLTVLHTIFMREHNRIANELTLINPHWEDERLYQEARRIIIAITQHITFDEFLPMVLGKRLMHDYKINVDSKGHWNGYEANIDPTATEEFATAAFRFGHSLLPHRIHRYSNAHHFIEGIELHRLIRQPFNIFKPGHLDTYILGMVNQLAQAMDEGVTDQVTNLLFRKPNEHFGFDLAAMNIARGRDHAIPGYAAYRKLCGLSSVESWEDLYGIMKNETVNKYRNLYKSPIEIDLWSAGISEKPNLGSLLGKTFGCIIAKQFQSLRYGDKHWYELPNLPSSFTSEQLSEIKKVRLSRILCDNTDKLKTIQVYAMMLPDPHQNPRVPCQGSVLSRIDLNEWKEIPQKTDRQFGYKHETGNQQENFSISLLPPKFDSSFVGIKTIYNMSHETTSYPKQSPNYPDFQPPKSIPEDVNLPDALQKEQGYHSYNEISHPTEDSEYSHHRFPEPEILEVLAAPPVGGPTVDKDSVIFVPNNLYRHPQSFQTAPRRFAHFNKPNLNRGIKTGPFPSSPFPGLSGIFSPNPGYLVKQMLTLPKSLPFKG